MGTIAQDLILLSRNKTAIKEAIEAKGGAVGDAPFSQYAAAIAALPSRGGDISQLTVTENGTYTAAEGAGYSPVVVNVPSSIDSNIDKILSGVGYIGDIVNNNITTLRGYALGGYGNTEQLHGFYSTSLTSIATYGLANQLNLKVVDCPNCTSLGNYAISTIRKLETLRLGSPLSVGANCLNNCSMDSLVLGEVNITAQAAFATLKATEATMTIGSSGLKGYDFRNSTTVVFNLRGVTAIPTACFNGCNSVTTVNLPDALAADIFASSSGTSFGSLRAQAAIVCQDADIRNVGGAWTIVER